MKKFHLRPVRLLTLPLMLLLLASLSLLPVHAQTQDIKSDSTYEYATFSFDESGAVVAHYPGGDQLGSPVTKTYRPYDGKFPDRVTTLPLSGGLKYDNDLEGEDQKYDVYTEAYAGDYLYVMGREGHCAMYVTEDAVQKMEDMLSARKFDRHVIRLSSETERSRFSHLSDRLYRDITARPTSDDRKLTLSPSALRYAPHYELVDYLETDSWVGICNGLLYQLDEEYYYLDLTTLSPSELSAGGGLNYDAYTTVTLWRLSESCAEDVQKAINNYRKYNGFEYEDNLLSSFDGHSIAIGLTVIVCVLAALAPIIVGLVKYRRQHKRRWFLLVGMGLLWLLCGLLIVGLLIFI